MIYSPLGEIMIYSPAAIKRPTAAKALLLLLLLEFEFEFDVDAKAYRDVKR